MLLALLASALLAQPFPDEPSTAGQLYNGCVRYATEGRDPRSASDEEAMAESTCAATVLVELLTMSTDTLMIRTMREPGRRRYCAPQAFLNSDDLKPAVRIFIAYVDRNPAAREAGADEIFRRAFAEQWPCQP